MQTPRPATRTLDFPPEILLVVVDQLVENTSARPAIPKDIVKTLCAITLVNHFLRDHALRYLYSSIHLATSNGLQLFARTLRQVPKLGDLVRSVIVWESPSPESEDTDVATTRTAIVADYEALASVLHSVGSLRRFCIERSLRTDEWIEDDDAEYAPIRDSRKRLETVIMTHSALTLEEFASIQDELYLSQSRPQTALAVHSLRNLRRLSIYNPLISTEWIVGMRGLSRLSHFCATNPDWDAPIGTLVPSFIEGSESLKFMRFIMIDYPTAREESAFLRSYNPPLGCVFIVNEYSPDMSASEIDPIQVKVQKKLEDGSLWLVDPPAAGDGSW